MATFNFHKRKKKDKVLPITRYLNHLKKIIPQQPSFYKEETLLKDAPGIIIIVYKDVPRIGCLTGITYGLSLVNHPNWKQGRAELCITIESSCIDWPLVAGYVANKLRGNFDFSYGRTITFDAPVCGDSDMDTFFIFAPGIFDADEYLDIDIGMDYKINIAGLYPMYSDELKIYNKIGFVKFWQHASYNNYNIKRKRITGL